MIVKLYTHKAIFFQLKGFVLVVEEIYKPKLAPKKYLKNILPKFWVKNV